VDPPRPAAGGGAGSGGFSGDDGILGAPVAQFSEVFLVLFLQKKNRFLPSFLPSFQA
jgi:hypothetical protein